MNIALAIDIGTTRIKYACIDTDGAVVHYHAFAVRYAAQAENSDIGGWFDELMAGIGDIPAAVRRQLRAITVSGQGPSLIALDGDGAVLRPLLLRSLLDDDRSAKRRAAGGSSHYIPFAAQYARRYPDVMRRVQRWIPLPEYCVYLLCGRAVSMLPSASYRRYYWTPAALRRAHLAREHFPSPVYMGDIIGGLSAPAAARCGLPPGIPLVSAGLDFCMAIIGGQCMRRYAVCDRAGSTQGLNFIGYPRRRHPLLQSYPLLRRSLGNQSLLLLNSGALLEGITEAQLDAVGDMIRRPPTATSPPLPTVRQRGVAEIVPADGSATARLHALESVLFTMRYVVELFPPHCRRHAAVALCGGQARIEKWNILKSDVLGMECRQFQCLHTELLGGAAVAFRAVNIYPQLADAVARISHTRRQFRPAQQLVATDLPRYRAFCSLLERTIGRRR